MADREYTSAEILRIAGRRMRSDPDPEVRAMAASLVTQARDRITPTSRPRQIAKAVRHLLKGSSDA